MVGDDTVERARTLLEKNCSVAMTFAQSEERSRCVRVCARWSAFLARHGASDEVLAVLAKIAIEINSGDEPGKQWLPEDIGVPLGGRSQ